MLSISSDVNQTYKLYTLEKLINLPLVTPNIQRAIDETVVASICEFQVNRFKERQSFLFLGHLTVGNVGNSMFLLDGQHRLKAIRSIYLFMPTYQILVLHLNITSSFSLIDAFSLMNKSTPVPDYVIQTTMDNSKRAIIDEFVTLFTALYRPYLSKSTRPQRPNVNVTQVADAIHNSNLLSEINSAQGLIDYIKYLNINIFPSLDPKNVRKCIDKVKDIPNSNILYISCDKDFTFPSYYEEYKNRPYASTHFQLSHPTPTSHPPVHSHPPPLRPQPLRDDDDDRERDPETGSRILKKRKCVPKSIRTQLWDKYFQRTSGKCPICSADFNINTMHSGHIVSVVNGGSDMLTNLLPICSGCNASIGSENMNTFVKRYYQKDMIFDLNSDKIIIK